MTAWRKVVCVFHLCILVNFILRCLWLERAKTCLWSYRGLPNLIGVFLLAVRAVLSPGILWLTTTEKVARSTLCAPNSNLMWCCYLVLSAPILQHCRYCTEKENSNNKINEFWSNLDCDQLGMRTTLVLHTGRDVSSLPFLGLAELHMVTQEFCRLSPSYCLVRLGLQKSPTTHLLGRGLVTWTGYCVAAGSGKPMTLY